MHFADGLVRRIEKTGSRLVVGLDPHWDLIPESFRHGRQSESVESVLRTYFVGIVDATCDVALAYKPQIAFFEQFGPPGLTALGHILDHIHARGSLVFMDAKRNDIGSTAAAYARAYFGQNGFDAPFPSDALTLNGYLGIDGILPFLRPDRGVFVLAKTSNPSSNQIQDLPVGQGMMVCQAMADLICSWNQETLGTSGYGNVGAVVGATFPEHMRLLRARLPHSFLLVPGLGAQKGSDEALKAAFHADGKGAVIAAARSICFPRDFAENGFRAVAVAAEQTRDHINGLIEASR